MPESEAEFDSLYRQELPRIFNFLLYQVGDRLVAEDLTSQTFEKAWRARGRYRADLSSFSTWLYTIARRVAVDHFRRAQAAVGIPEDEPSPEENPEAAVERALQLAHLARLLARLEPRERELIALSYGAGLSHVAISRITGLQETNVAVILHRTRTRLRNMWEAYDGR